MALIVGSCYKRALEVSLVRTNKFALPRSLTLLDNNTGRIFLGQMVPSDLQSEKLGRDFRNGNFHINQ